MISMLQEYTNILVPVDGSKEAELALNKAVQVAKLNKAHLDILNVLDTKQFIGGYGGMLSGDAIYQISEDAQDYLKNLAESIQSKYDIKDEDLAVHVRFGNPKTVISHDFPKDHKNDLIMIGATGLNAVERVLVGSVTEYVNQHALCDVLIVKTDEDNKPVKK
ncbi:universal stress family protein [Agrilactobacillus composti DSM 18527 = JCM 14202]|jgi:nucleotide-binding universal stress UspA family protein|uniref:Universal stress protein n=2 Tax=Agrilactobacillus TaxID=2767875 RepID=X0QJF3_9LACO|nr:universal stress family protein [Agrilactobacillus composti DSM 18527 = JCM 14202]GAF38745.1 universal stress protein family [Agrilactobacillus composti DSM 18527 = JCM 14202]